MNVKVKRFILVMASLFTLSMVLAGMDFYPNFISAYDFGKATGIHFKQVIKTFGVMTFLWIVLLPKMRGALPKG